MGENKHLKNERKYIRQAVEKHFDEWLVAVRQLPFKSRFKIAMSMIFRFLEMPKISAKR